MPLLAVEGLAAEHRSRGEAHVAAIDVSFDDRARASASPSSASRAAARRRSRAASSGSTRLDAGGSSFDGEALARLRRGRTREQCRRIQIVFQNPYDSLNPRHRVGETIARPAQLLRGLGAARGAPRCIACSSGPAARASGRPLPARALGRRAPARRDRARPGRTARPRRLRRGHLRARRLGAGGRVELLASCGANSGWRCCLSRTTLASSRASPTASRARARPRPRAGPVGRVITEPSDAYTRSLLAAVPRLRSGARGSTQNGAAE